jgi:hypothetical protein
MGDAFADAIDDLFADPNMVVTVLYQGRPVRALVRRPDQQVEFGDTVIVSATAAFEVRVAEVPAPVAGDALEVDGETYIVQGEPRRDAGRLVWTLDTRPA